MNRNLLRTGAVLASAAALVACGEQRAETAHPTGPVDVSQLEFAGAIKVKRGESKFSNVLIKNHDPALYQQLRDWLPLVNHQYRHGAIDPKAPVIDFVPSRLDAHVDSGRDSIENDAACDSLNIADPRAKSVGAIALSEEAGDAVLVAWPDPGPNDQANQVYVCSFEYREPANGVILYLDNE